MKNLKAFAAQFVALIEGDNAKANAVKVFRQRNSALESHLASLKGDVVDYEQDVEDAKTALTIARLNGGKLITDKEGRAKYIENLKDAKEAVTDAEEELESLNASIKFLEEELSYDFSDVYQREANEN